jgi:CRISPR-associated endonuclease/helicase Cas3
MSNFYAHVRKSDNHCQPLAEHLDRVAALSAEFAAKVGLAEFGYVMGRLHDLGKATLLFQRYLLSGAGILQRSDAAWMDWKRHKGKIDHATAGAQVVYAYLTQKGPYERIAAQVLALCIASHHSGLIDCITPTGENRFAARMAKAEAEVRRSEALANLPETLPLLDEHLTDDAIRQLARKLQSLQEGTNDKDVVIFKVGLLVRYLLSCLIDADRLNTADTERPDDALVRNYGNYVPWPTLIERLETKIADFDASPDRNVVDDLRRQVSEECLACASKPRGIYQLTVPTGGGKTLASLRFALHHAQAHSGFQHIFYIVPYISIIDQNAREIRAILEDRDDQGNYLDRVVLEHHSNLTPERARVDGAARQAQEPVEEENTRQSLLAQNWDAPVVLTTQVQFLEALFGSGTRSVRRMHQLANSIIILDEVQAFPVRTIQMLNVALRFLVHDCGATVVLCTATQPPLERIAAAHRALTLSAESHIIANEKRLFEQLKRVKVHDLRRPEAWNVEDLAQLAEQQMEACGSTLVVVNTRTQARALYKAIEARGIEGVTLRHLSTNMCAAHRLGVIEELKKQLGPDQPERVICISTQLIEAGVDIDFGAVIRYLAGLDSIAQSAGRCNRSGRRERMGQVFVVNTEGESLDKLKDIKIGADHARILLDRMRAEPTQYNGDPLGIDALAAFYDGVYRERAGEMKYPARAQSGFHRDENLFNLLSRNTMAVQDYVINNGKDPQLGFFQAFHSAAQEFEAIDSDTVGVIVQYAEGEQIVADLCSTEDIELQRRLMKYAQRYAVNLRRNEFYRLANAGIIQETQQDSGIYYLDKEYYSSDFGWSETPAGEMPLLLSD